MIRASRPRFGGRIFFVRRDLNAERVIYSMGFQHTGIRVRDLDRSIEFYTTVLGMQVTWRMKIRETGGAIAVLKSPRGTQRLELNWYPPRGRYRRYRQRDELDHLAFAVPDVRAFLAAHRGQFRVAMKPFKEGRDWLAYVTDPDGVWIELMFPFRAEGKASPSS